MDILNDVIIGQYIPGNSIIHKLDARVKILISILFIITIFFIKEIYPFILVMFFLILISKISKISIIYIFRGLKLLMYFFIFAFFLHIFFTKEGSIVFHYGIVKITDIGLKNGTVIVLRLFLLVFSTTILTLTTSPVNLTEALERLGKPLKKVGFPVHEFAMMTTIALRFIPTLFEEINKIMKAQISRGAQLDTGNIIERAKNFLSILVPLFANSFKRADELAIAMEVRCYRGDEGRTKMNPAKTSLRDYIAFFISAAFMIIIFLIRKVQ